MCFLREKMRSAWTNTNVQRRCVKAVKQSLKVNFSINKEQTAGIFGHVVRKDALLWKLLVSHDGEEE